MDVPLEFRRSLDATRLSASTSLSVTIRSSPHNSEMTLGPRARLGPYEIQSAIGAGGMGEVYRARDTRLDRDVAIKVLPDVFASDPERLAPIRA